MGRFSRFLISLALFGLFSMPLSASAFVSFGGRIVSVIPCSGGMHHVTISSARVGAFGAPEFYIWTPFTITKLQGPPISIGQQILGLADIPFVCFLGGGGFFSSPVPLYGLRMQIVGTSFPFSGGGLF